MTATTDLASADLFHITAANGINYAYRSFGDASGTLPVVFLQHLRSQAAPWIREE